MRKLYSFIMAICLAVPSYAFATDNLKTKIPGDYVLGSNKAKITLIEYASLSCPHCADFHSEVLPTIQKEYVDTGKVRVIFRDFPLNGPALAAAQLAQCAGKKGSDSYYLALKKLFAEQKNWAFDKQFKAKLAKIGNGLGMDDKTVESCFADKEIENKIIVSRKNGSEVLGVNSTPSFFLNGEKADLRSVDKARKTLDTLLTGKTLEQESKAAAKKLLVAKSDDRVLGDAKAKVTIIEYVNIACPHCGQFHQTLISTLQKDYIDTGKVKLVFRELPMSPSAFYAYMLANCKGKDEFYDTIGLLIKETRSWTASPAFLTPLRAVAEKKGINKEAFYACMENKDAETRILTHSQEASEILGIDHSPTIFINGEKTEQLNTPDAIRQAVDAALQRRK